MEKKSLNKILIISLIFIIIFSTTQYYRTQQGLPLKGDLEKHLEMAKTLTKLVYLTCTIFITLNLIHWIFESINLCILSFA